MKYVIITAAYKKGDRVAVEFRPGKWFLGIVDNAMGKTIDVKTDNGKKTIKKLFIKINSIE